MATDFFFFFGYTHYQSLCPIIGERIMVNMSQKPLTTLNFLIMHQSVIFENLSYYEKMYDLIFNIFSITQSFDYYTLVKLFFSCYFHHVVSDVTEPGARRPQQGRWATFRIIFRKIFKFLLPLKICDITTDRGGGRLLLPIKWTWANFFKSFCFSNISVIHFGICP